MLAPKRLAGVALRGEYEEIHHSFGNKSRAKVTRSAKSAFHKTNNALQKFPEKEQKFFIDKHF